MRQPPCSGMSPCQLPQLAAGSERAGDRLRRL